MKHEEKVLTCLYAITGHDVPEKVISEMPGIAGEPLYPVRYKEIAAIAGTAKKNRFAFDKSAALAYGMILDTLCESFTVLPCRFGALLNDDGAVTEVLQKRYAFYERKLVELEGKKEFGLKIFSGAKDSAMCSIQCDKKPNDGKEYILQKFQQFKADNELKKGTERAIDVIRLELQEISSKFEESSQTDGQVAFSGNYLVEKKDADFFCSKVKVLQGQYSELKFLLTGPWPPYNFVF